MPSRRVFLKQSALAMFGVGTVPIWLTRAAYAENEASKRKKILIVVFQRGAVDGLNVVVPHAEPAYYAMRPSIAIPRPDGTDRSAIDLDGRFGLHPSLRPLKTFWDRKELAIVEAVGSPDPTRSHFDAQDYMESGTPGVKATSDGWLNRALCTDLHAGSLRAVGLGTDVPRTLRGKNEVLAISSIADFRVQDAHLGNTFESMYADSVDRILNGTGRETFQAAKILEAVQKAPYQPQNRAEYPKGRLGQSMLQIARLIRANVGLEVAFADMGGWDTHVNEVAAQPHQGQLANLLGEFGSSLAAFAQDMGDRMADITVVTMSEFGRTVKENGDRGTDHGHANYMFVLGGDVQGGHVYGRWPGLAPEKLYEGRDLMVTTDFRAVLSELVLKQLGNRQLSSVFPGYSAGVATTLLS
jgi:uncharacterized protein (DUF1501 family)